MDHVAIFHEENPLNLIKAVNPQVLVKGGDWAPSQIIGSDHVLSMGGEVKSLKFIDGFSTTSFIKSLQGQA